MVVLILNQVSSTPRKGNAEDYIAALGLKNLPVIITFIISLIWLAFLIVFLGGAGWALVDIFGKFGQQDIDLRWPLLTLAGMMAALGAIISLPFTLLRTQYNRRQTYSQEESLFNNKMISAAQGLAARREVTRVVGRGKEQRVLTEWQDDLITRASSIDRLEGLARERPDAAARVVQMLSIYVRELSREYPAQEPPKDANSQDLRRWSKKLKPVRTDMEKAAQSLGRLQTIKGHTIQPRDLDLRRANLQGFNLEKSDFSGAMLREARLDGAILQGREDGILKGSNFQKANLLDTSFIGASASESQFQGANIGADFTAAILDKSEFEFFETDDKSSTFTDFNGRRSKFIDAQLLNTTIIFSGTPTKIRVWAIGAEFQGAMMQGCLFVGFNHFYEHCWPTQFGHKIRGGKGLAFRNCQLTGEIINRCSLDMCFGDGSVALPDGTKDWPKHWPTSRLSDADFTNHLENWRNFSA